MRSKYTRLALTLAFAFIAGIVLLRTFAQMRKGTPGQDEEVAGKTPSRVFMRNGETVIRLSPGGQSRAGIETLTLDAVRERRKVTAPAVVLDVQGLVNLTANYATAQANLRKAENNLAVSQPEYDRLKTLYSKQQNVSAKAFQAAEGMFHSDQTDVRMTRRNLELQVAALRQSWGDAIATWATSGEAELERILNRQDTMVQVTLSADGPATAPREVWLELPNQRVVTASLVSCFPQVDPRIQGASFLYITRTQGTLAPGLNLMARFPAGSRVAGVVVPSSAVVWLNGEPWVYIETAPNEFARRPVSTNYPVGGGFFVSKGLSPGERTVRAGAQALLSEEFRTQSQGGGEGDTD